MENLKILIITGEESGDMHGGKIAENILKLAPTTQISGVSGTNMKNAGVNIFFDIKSLAIMDVTEFVPNRIVL